LLFFVFCSYIFVHFKLTFMLKWWNTMLSRNLSELLYLSLGRSSHKISPSSWKNAAKLMEKQDEWSTQSLPQSLTFFTEAETKGVMFKWRNLWTAKLAKAKPFPECRFKLFVPSRYISVNAGNKEFIKMQNKIISNVADPNKAILSSFQRLLRRSPIKCHVDCSADFCLSPCFDALKFILLQNKNLSMRLACSRQSQFVISLV